MSTLLTEIQMAPSQLDRARDRGQLVLKVHPHSPAEQLGLVAGWVVLSMERGSVDEDVIFGAQLDLKHRSFLFADPEGRVYRSESMQWPFGIVAAPWPGRALAKAIVSADFGWEELTRFWKEGALSVYPPLIRPLERYLSRSKQSFWAALRGRTLPRTELAEHPEYNNLAILALAYAISSNWADAEFYLNASRDSRIRANQASYSTIDMSMDRYTESLIAEAKGEQTRARELAVAAKQLAPDIWEVERRLAALQHRAPEMEVPAWTGGTFPLDYNLPAKDPVGEIRNNIEHVSFSQVIGSLTDGEMLVVLVLGEYRSNYYYNLDLVKLAILNQAFPGTIREVHAITSGTYALDVNHRHWAEGLARNHNLPFAILWDEADIVAKTLQPAGYPANFLVDRHARILATERLMEEEGFWKAVQRRATPH